jgi:hypothetical protein
MPFGVLEFKALCNFLFVFCSSDTQPKITIVQVALPRSCLPVSDDSTSVFRLVRKYGKLITP